MSCPPAITIDAWNRLTTATPQLGWHEEFYTYDPTGRRVTDLDGIRTGAGPLLFVNNGGAQRSMVNTVTVYFPQTVTLGTGALTLYDNTTSSAITPLGISNTFGDLRTFLIAFPSSALTPGNSLTDGSYTLTLDHTKVTGISQQVLFAIGDVCGHGFGAALVMSTARGILRSRAMHSSRPDHLLSQVLHDDATDTH
ncbi:MAG: serine/threonine-protein phosphatase [Planctomycetota bacterium]|nr:serine/threonine-protein phosphatase [Planctomycetota bacterium]